MLDAQAQARAEQIAHDLARRQDLVRDFVVAASKTYGQAMVSNEPNLQEIVGLYSMVSRMRVLGMPRSVGYAERLMKAIIDAYFAPNRTLRELHEMVKNGKGAVDPLREFSEAARDELAPIKSAY